MTIFVAKLNFATSDADLRYAFEEFGEVESANIIMDKGTGKSKGYGFVEMPNDEDCLKAIQELDDTELDGRTIVVKQAEKRETRSNNNNRGGGGGGGYGNNGGGGGGGYGNRRY